MDYTGSSLAVSVNLATSSATGGDATGDTLVGFENAIGSANARRLRTEGKVPGVVYGQGGDTETVTVVRRDLRVALSGPAGFNALITLNVGGTPVLTIVRDLQRDPMESVVE